MRASAKTAGAKGSEKQSGGRRGEGGGGGEGRWLVVSIMFHKFEFSRTRPTHWGTTLWLFIGARCFKDAVQDALAPTVVM